PEVDLRVLARRLEYVVDDLADALLPAEAVPQRLRLRGRGRQGGGRGRRGGFALFRPPVGPGRDLAAGWLRGARAAGGGRVGVEVGADAVEHLAQHERPAVHLRRPLGVGDALADGPLQFGALLQQRGDGHQRPLVEAVAAVDVAAVVQVGAAVDDVA